MAEFVMPSLGADMEAGTLFEWMVKPGDTVQRGDIIANVETVKGVIEIEVFIDGVVEEILVEEGTEVPVGSVLAIIRSEGEPAAEKVKAPAAEAASEAQEAEAHPMDQQRVMTGNGHGRPEPVPAASPAGKPAERSQRRERIRVSPAARRRAKELGIDLGAIDGTGPDGAISLTDVEDAAAAAEREREKAEAAEVKAVEAAARVRISPVARRLADDLHVDVTTLEGSGPRGTITREDVVSAACAAVDRAQAQPSTPVAKAPAKSAPPKKPKAKPAAPSDGDAFQAGIRRAIAAAMSRANREIPHYYLESRIDMSKALSWLEAENARRSMVKRILPAVLQLKAVAAALRDVPQLNGFWRDDALEIAERVNIGFAIALRQGGLVTPALHDVDGKDFDEVMADLRDLIMRTRAGRLRSSEMTDATITLTNLGDLGVDKVFGVIYPPQVALVGFGKTLDQVWVQDGMLGVRPVACATLAGDHRATDGRTGAQFLDALNKHLQEPESL